MGRPWNKVKLEPDNYLENLCSYSKCVIIINIYGAWS